MSTLWRKVLADFWANKTRTFLMVLTITLGVFSVGFVGDVGAMMNRDMDADYNSASPSHAIIYAAPFDDDWVKSLKRVPGVKAVEGRTQVVAQYVAAGGEKTPIQFDAIRSYQSVKVNTLKPADPQTGLLPDLGRRDVVFDRSAAPFGLQPGQKIEIELANGEKRMLYFKGYVHDVTTFPYGMSGVIPAYVTPETAEYLGGPASYNELLVSVAEDPTDAQHVSDVANAVTGRFKKNDVVAVGGTSIYNPGHHFGWQVTQGVIFILSTLGWMTVILSGFLIVNTIVALMSQHVRQIGIMKAIGGGTGQIFSMYLALLLAFGLLALAISIPLAGWASYQTGIFLAGF